MYGNTSEGAKAIKRWSKGYDNDFAARMDWSITSKYQDANHHPIAVRQRRSHPGEFWRSPRRPVPASRSAPLGSSDPDGNALSYSWSFYKEPGSYAGSVTIEDSSSPDGHASPSRRTRVARPSTSSWKSMTTARPISMPIAASSSMPSELYTDGEDRYTYLRAVAARIQ